MTFPLKTFHLSGFRNYQQAQVQLSSDVTLVSGPNGAGKTSLLEAIHVLATGRSFRTGRHDKLVSDGAEFCLLRAELECGGVSHQVGMERGRQGLHQLKMDGERLRNQSPVAQKLPVVALHPDTVALVEGGAEVRRRLFDWLMFHVEHDFLPAWQSLKHAVRQRNGALKKPGLSMQELAVWDRQLAETSGRIDRLRQARFVAFKDAFQTNLAGLSDELPGVAMRLFSGWDSSNEIADLLIEKRDTDRSRGFSTVGAHRMDLRLSTDAGAVKELLSRGQKKLVAYALVLAALEVIASEASSEQQCVVLVDDLASELDADHGRRVFEKLASLPHQVIITALDPVLPEGWAPGKMVTMFHVEHGQLKPV